MGRSGGVEQGGHGRGWAVPGPAAGAALAALICGAAQAQTQVQGPAQAPAAPRGDFPATNSEPDILRWIATRTSIPRASILMLEPRAVVALGLRTPAGSPGSLAHAEVREELISPEATTRSAIFSVELDCAGRRFRIVDRKTFALPDLKGEGQFNPQPGAWSPVVDGAPVAKAWQAICTTDFVYPYGSQTISTATLAPRPALPPPAAPPVRKLAALAAPTSAPAAPPTASYAGGPYQAVLGSYSVRENAVAASDKLSRVLARDLQGRRKSLVTVTVKGTVYTALTVSGFATAAEASGFCNAARAVPLACMVRRGNPG